LRHALLFLALIPAGDKSAMNLEAVSVFFAVLTVFRNIWRVGSTFAEYVTSSKAKPMDRLDAASAVVVILASANKSAMNLMWVCLPFYGLFREFSKLPSSDHQLPATHDDYYHKL
jgi:hypothetical protein